MPIRANLQLLLAQANVERAKRGETTLSLRQLAKEANITPSVVSTLASGKTERIDFSTIDKLLNYFNQYLIIDAGDLLVWMPEENEDA